MASLLVTYTIDDPDHEVALNHYLDRFDSLRLSATSRIVDTEVAPQELFAELEQELGQDDRIYVFSLGQKWIGYGYEATHDWLHRHVGPGPAPAPRCP